MAQNELDAFLNYGVRLIQLTTELTVTLVDVVDTHDHGKVVAVGLELGKGGMQLGLVVESWYIGTRFLLIKTQRHEQTVFNALKNLVCSELDLVD